MTDLHTKVVGLLNELHGSENKAQKIRLLKGVEDVVVKKDPGLLDSFFDELIQVQSDPEPGVRIQLVNLLEASCSQDIAILTRAAATLEYLLADESPAVVKRVIRCCSNVTRVCFAQVAAHTMGRQPIHEEAWQTCTQLKAIVLGLRGDDNIGVKCQVFHFMETLVLLFSYRTRGSVNTQQADASLDAVAAEHPFLKPTELRKEGRTLFSTLVATLLATDNTISSVLASAITNSLTAIAERRPVFMGPVVAALVRFLDEPPTHFSTSAVRSLRRTLRAELLILFKHEASAEFHDELVPRLEGLDVAQRDINDHDKRSEVRARPLAPFLPEQLTKEGFARAAEKAEAEGEEKAAGDEEKGKKAEEGQHEKEEEEEEEKKLAGAKKEEEAEQAAKPEQRVSALEKAAQEQMAKYPFEKLKQDLPASSIIQLVMASLLALPDTIETDSAETAESSELTARAHRAAPKHESRQAERQRGKVREAVRKDEAESTLAPALPETPKMEKKAKARPAMAAPRPAAKRFQLKPVTLSAEVKQQLCTAAFRRILTNVRGRRRARTRSAFTTVAAQLLSGQEESEDTRAAQDSMTREAMGVIEADPIAHGEFISTWLFHEWWRVATGTSVSSETELQAKAGGKAGEVSSMGSNGEAVTVKKEEGEEEEEAVGKQDQGRKPASGDESAANAMDTAPDEGSSTAGATVTAAAAQQGSGPFTRYDTCALLCLKALLSKLPASEGTISRLMCDGPRVTPAHVTATAAVLGASEQHTTFVLRTLTAVAKRRVDCRRACVDTILDAVTSSDADIRAEATSTCLDLFRTAPSDISSHCLDFAERAMQAGLKTDKSPEETKAEVQRQCHLFFHLITDHDVPKFSRVMKAYAHATPPAKRALLSLLSKPVLAMRRTDSEALFSALLDFPPNAESLVLRVLHTVCDAEEAAKQTVSNDARACASALYNRTKDVRFLIPIISNLSQVQIENHLKEFISLPPRVVKQVMQRLLRPSCRLDPPSLLILLHRLEPDSTLPISSVISAVDACFQRRDVFTQPLLSGVLEQLAELDPPPRLLMRTVIQTLHLYQGLKRFVINTIFPPFLKHKRWSDDNLLKGFVKCVELTMPEAAQFLEGQSKDTLQSLFTACPELATTLKEHCTNNPNSVLCSVQAEA